jgi:hypothetical protein
MKKSTGNKRPYKSPTILGLGKAEEMTLGNGYTYTDYLGDPTTRYGTPTEAPKKPDGPKKTGDPKKAKKKKK